MLRMPRVPSLSPLKPPPPFPLPPQWWVPPPPHPLPPQWWKPPLPNLLPLHPPSVLPPKWWKPESRCRQVTASEPSLTLRRRAYPNAVLASIGSMPHPSALRLKRMTRTCRVPVTKSSRGFATAQHQEGTAWNVATLPLSTTSATLHSLPALQSYSAVRSGCNKSATASGDEVIPPKFYQSVKTPKCS